MMIAAEHNLLSMQYSNFFVFYLLLASPTWLNTGFAFLFVTDVFLAYKYFGAFII